MSIVKHVVILLLLWLLWLPSMSAAAALPVLHHDLRFTPDSKTGELQVEDTLRISTELRKNGQFSFMLNPQFTLNVDSSPQPTQA